MPFRICQVAAEAAPFAKTGGLGDVTAGLSRYLARQGADVRLFLPFYAQLARESERFVPVEFIQDVPVKLGATDLRYGLRTAKLPDSDVDVYFVDCPALFHRDGIYQGDWFDSRRFGLLSIAALEGCQRMGFVPDILHVHDWHTAMAPLLLRTHFAWDRLFERTKTVLTIHNAGYQGIVSRDLVDDLGLGRFADRLDQRDLASGVVNCLKTGLLTADVVTAVSETYAHEIQGAGSSEHGHGLESLFRARGVIGIVNGVDYGEWDPAHDRHLPATYTIDDLAGKAENKRALLRDVGMDAAFDGPLLGIVSRLTPQKGFEIVRDALPFFLAQRDVRLVALGSGDPRDEEYFASLAARFPGRAWFYRGFNNPLAHRIEAAADIFLMPSRFEPCGLNQLYSLRYGTPPIVHKTGGLADTVQPFDPHSGEGTGFVFDHFTPDGFAWALDSALQVFPHREHWRRLQRNGMARDYSWDVQGKRYAELFRALSG